MTVLQIILSSSDRLDAIKRLIAAGYSRQEAKSFTFGMDSYGTMNWTKNGPQNSK